MFECAVARQTGEDATRTSQRYDALMGTGRIGIAIALLLFLGAPSIAAEDPAARAAEARKLYGRADYGAALAIWKELIADHRKHPIVADGDAHEGAARCLEKRGEHAEVAGLYESYLRSHPRGQGVFKAHAGIFNAWVAAGDDARAQKAGKQIFKRYPDAKGTFSILMTWLEKKWKTPRLQTSYDVLHFWAFDRIDGSRWPDHRLAVLDIIANQHKREKLVKDHGILYCRAWCHLTAGRPAEAITLGAQYIKRKPRGTYADRTRIVVARAHLATTPPAIAAATRLLEIVANGEDAKQRDIAKDLLAQTGAGPASIQIVEGFPTSEGLGRVVLLTNLTKRHAMREALGPWMEARQAEVVTFRGRDVAGAAAKLRKLGHEFVAVAVEPGTIDNDFQLSMLELCRGLDEDPMPDFHYGYLTARSAEDLGALTRRILEKEKEGGRVAREVSPPKPGLDFAGIDFFIHYGHGTSRRIVDGVSARDLDKITLPSRPIIFSGACFNGVCARTHERFSLGNHHGKPDELEVDEAISLAWIHAGATGLFAALDGDRGEMAGAEWEHFKEHAPPLGAVIGYQYRLTFTSLREAFETFPRYTPGERKNKTFYHVMLRGQTSRILISDPSYRPLAKPLTKPSQRWSVHTKDDGTLEVKVEVLRRTNGPFVNTLPTTAGTPFKEVRLYARVPLPRGYEGSVGFPAVDSGGIDLTKVQAKHEVWGGRRYVNLQAESRDGKLASAGTVVTYTFERVK